MALATSNVNTVTDSFQNWVDKTNVLLDAYSTTIVTTAANSQGGITTGNGTVNGIFTANSVTVNGNTTFGLRGGNTTVANVLYVTSNVSIGNTTVNTVFTTTTLDTDLALSVLGAATLSNSLSVTGNTTLTGNATLSGTLQTISGNATFDSGVLFVDATNNRVGINNTAPTVALEVTGAANISTSVNSALLTVGTAFIANTTGAYHTGTVNAASYTTTGFVANTTSIAPTANTILLGNSIGRFIISANTGDFSGNVVISGTANVTGNVVVSGTANIAGNVTMSGTLQTISGNVNIDTGTVFVDATNNRLGVNTASPGVALDVVGSANISTSVNSALLTIGTSFIANTTGVYHTGTINAASYTTTGFVANTTAIIPTSNTILLGNSTGRFVLFANTGTFSGAVSGITTLAAGNTTITGFVNATSTIQGGSSLTIAGAASGITTLAAGNTTITGFANISTSVNSALLTIGTTFIANTIGVYHTGIINAASFTTTGIVANTTAIVPTSNTILLGNTVGRFVISANTGDFTGSMVIRGTATVNSSLSVTGNVSINTFATFLTLANTDLGSNTTANVTVVSFPKASYQAGELLVYVTKGTEFQTTKILYVHNGTDVNQTVYGTVVAPSSSSELANNIALSVNSTNIDVTMKQRVPSSSVKIIANMIS